jgi:hypothetical protein
MIRFWKWLSDFSTRKFLSIKARKNTKNSYKMKAVVIDYNQWTELVSAVGELETKILIDYVNSTSPDEKSFFKNRLTQVRSTIEQLETAW